MKKIIFALILFISLISNVYADNTIDFSKKGAMNVVIKIDDTKGTNYVSGVELTSYLIATIDNSTYNLKYNWVEELKDINLSLNDLDELNNNKKLILNYIEENNIDLSTFTKYSNKTNDEGKLTFSNMELGLYLVEQTNKVNGYDKIESYLVTVPYLDSNDEWNYVWECEPKPPLDRLMDLKVIKVWNNNRTTNPDSITFELRLGNEEEYEVIDTIELNEENEWTYSFEQIHESNDYYVVEINCPRGYKVNYSDNYELDEEVLTFTITNTAKLPQTGTYTYLIPIFLVIGVVCIGFGILLERRNEYE